MVSPCLRTWFCDSVTVYTLLSSGLFPPGLFTFDINAIPVLDVVGPIFLFGEECLITVKRSTLGNIKVISFTYRINYEV